MAGFQGLEMNLRDFIQSSRAPTHVESAYTKGLRVRQAQDFGFESVAVL
jgi:hypothetical protein